LSLLKLIPSLQNNARFLSFSFHQSSVFYSWATQTFLHIFFPVVGKAMLLSSLKLINTTHSLHPFRDNFLFNYQADNISVRFPSWYLPTSSLLLLTSTWRTTVVTARFPSLLFILTGLYFSKNKVNNTEYNKDKQIITR